MRSHGVPNFPDPSPGGPSVIPNWINPQALAFLSAQKACARFLGGGSPAAGAEGEKLALLNLAKCIRARGLPNFPDPTTSPPPAPAPGSHTGNAIGIGGVYLMFPPQSPTLKRAEATCGPGAQRQTAIATAPLADSGRGAPGQRGTSASDQLARVRTSPTFSENGPDWRCLTRDPRRAVGLGRRYGRARSALTAGDTSTVSGASIRSCSVTGTPALASASINRRHESRGGRCCSGSRPSIWLTASWMSQSPTRYV